MEEVIISFVVVKIGSRFDLAKAMMILVISLESDLYSLLAHPVSQRCGIDIMIIVSGL
jgi:hypothetical protein